MDAKLKQAFVDSFASKAAVGRRYGAVAAQASDGPVAVQHHVRNVPVGVGKMRGVGGVERIGANLDGPSFTDFEVAREPEVHVEVARADNAVEARSAEGRRRYGSKGQRVKPGLSRANVAKNRNA